MTDDQIVDTKSGETVDAEYDPADLLNYWLEELDMSKMVSKLIFTGNKKQRSNLS